MWSHADLNGLGQTGLGDVVPAFTTGPQPAGTPAQARAGGREMGPITLTPPMPSITPPPPEQVTPDDVGGLCGVNGWVNENPLMALASVIVVWNLLKGGRS